MSVFLCLATSSCGYGSLLGVDVGIYVWCPLLFWHVLCSEGHFLVLREGGSVGCGESLGIWWEMLTGLGLGLTYLTSL